MPEPPDTITVTGTAAQDVAASHADIMVNVAGSASFGADQAVAKAREVTALVTDLAGTAEVEVLGVATHASSGRLARGSDATYRLRVRTDSVEQVPRVIDVVAAQKNAGIEHIEWRYPELAGRTQALQRAIADASATAATTAEALGVELLAVHAFTERTFDEDHGPMPRMMAAAAESVPSLDIDVMHRKTVRVQVEITYRVR